MAHRYRLDGRRFEGSLQSPTRNDSLSAESDDWTSLRRQADTLAAQGYTVWLWDHSRRPAPVGASDLHLVEQIHPPDVGSGAAGAAT